MNVDIDPKTVRTGPYFWNRRRFTRINKPTLKMAEQFKEELSHKFEVPPSKISWLREEAHTDAGFVEVGRGHYALDEGRVTVKTYVVLGRAYEDCVSGGTVFDVKQARENSFEIKFSNYHYASRLGNKIVLENKNQRHEFYVPDSYYNEVKNQVNKYLSDPCTRRLLCT